MSKSSSCFITKKGVLDFLYDTGFTQERLAHELGMSMSGLRKWITKGAIPHLKIRQIQDIVRRKSNKTLGLSEDATFGPLSIRDMVTRIEELGFNVTLTMKQGERNEKRRN